MEPYPVNSVMVSYKVKGGVVEVAERESGASGVVEAVGRGMTEFSAYAGDFRRGRLFLTREGIVYVPSPNESTIKNAVGGALSKGPINPLRLLGLYKPYAANLADASERDGAWAVSYADVDGLSLLSKSSGNELFVRTSGTPSVLYRIRNETGTDYVGVYRGNRKYAKRFAGEIYGLANEEGGAVEFDAGPDFSVYTKQREIPEDRQISREDLPTAPPRTFDSGTGPSGTRSQSEGETTTAASARGASPTGARARSDSRGRAGGSTSELRLRNEADASNRITVGCRTESGVVFTDRVALGSGEETSWEELPEKRFQIGVSGAVEATETFRPTELDGPLVATVTGTGVDFGVESEGSLAEEAERTATPDPERHGASQHEGRTAGPDATDRGGEAGSDRTFEADAGDAPDSRAADGEGGEESDGLELRLLGFGAVVLFLVFPTAGIVVGPGLVTFAAFLVGSALSLAGVVQAVRSWLA